jgi:hypothetical protein
MRIESDNHGDTAGGLSVLSRGRNDGLVSAMNAVKDADGEEEGASQGAQFFNRLKDLHHVALVPNQ